jgi:hypothetical protein
MGVKNGLESYQIIFLNLREFFFINNVVSLKSANECNPSTYEAYKSAFKKKKQNSRNLKTLQT